MAPFAKVFEHEAPRSGKNSWRRPPVELVWVNVRGRATIPLVAMRMPNELYGHSASVRASLKLNPTISTFWTLME